MSIVFAELATPTGTVAGTAAAVLRADAPRLFATDVSSATVMRAAAPSLYGFDGGLRVHLIAPRPALFAADTAAIARLVPAAPQLVISVAPVPLPSLAVASLQAPAFGISAATVQRLFAGLEIAAPAPRLLATDVDTIARLTAEPPTMFVQDIEPPLINFAYLVQGPGVLSMTSGAYVESLHDAFLMSAAVRSQAVFALMDSLGLGAAPSSQLAAGEVLHDDLGMGDVLGLIWTVLASDSIGLGATPTGNARVLAEMVDTLRLIAGAGSTLAAMNAVASAMALRDAVGVMAIEQLADGLGLSATVRDSIKAYAQLIDTIALQAVGTGQAILSALVSDTLALNDAATSTAAMIEQLRDGMGLTVTLRLGDDTYFAWVCNTQTKAFTSYTNFPFNSFAQIGRRYFAAADDGIYELTGDSDDGQPIQARIRTGLTNLGTGRMKRMPSLYLGYTATGVLVLKAVTTSPTGEKREDWYELRQQTAESTREGRIKLGKGLKSVFWGFELVNVDGAAFALDDLKLYPMLCDRRI